MRHEDGAEPVMPRIFIANPGGVAAPACSPLRAAAAICIASDIWPGVGAVPGSASITGTPMPQRRLLVAWTRIISRLSRKQGHTLRNKLTPCQAAPSRSFANHAN
jgi:hypothetical protein